ncbi:HNH endonuclease signature motif containing protein, partial [Marinobacterium sp. xm-d-509]|uniref:HNH endonuclease signature motif containing protein n=1 Tax=Marinobacterium sp. xm-d-509 TaxID=2497739 RepID=UPI001568D282
SISSALKRRGDRTIEETLGGYTRAEAVAFTIPFAEERLRLETETGEAYHIHHKRSISIGGTHTPDNLCVITERENVAMGNCWFLEDDLTDEDIERLDREALEFTP